MVCQGCDYKFKSADADGTLIAVKRYDRLESRYLTTGDFSALQEMNTEYPMETRTLVEKVLQLGEASDQKLNNRFLMFFQDSVLQTLISDVEAEYANVDDLNKGLNDAFDNLDKMLPGIPRPGVYLQISALDQSIIVGDNMIGVSLDKYMGSDYQLYKKYYTPQQMATMKRSYIVPDCLCFYLLSLYPMKNFDKRPQHERDIHVAKVLWVVNKSIKCNLFKNKYVSKIDKYMKCNRKLSVRQMLESDDYTQLND